MVSAIQTPKILIYDIETAPAIGLFFGKPYDVNIAKIIQHEYVFGFAYGWIEGDKLGKIKTCYMWDFPAYHKRIKPKNHTLADFLEAQDQRLRIVSREVLKVWSDCVVESPVIGGQNSDQFDYKQMFGRLPMYDLPPVAKPKTIDTKKMAKQIGAYPSNKLDDLGERFGIGKKLPHNDYPNAIDLWWACMNDVPKAQKHMVAYNIIDVKRTADLYLKLRPYSTNHPNMALIADQPDVCKVCGQNKGFTSAGWKYTTTRKYRYWNCKHCNHKNPGRTSEKLDLPSFA